MPVPSGDVSDFGRSSFLLGRDVAAHVANLAGRGGH